MKNYEFNPVIFSHAKKTLDIFFFFLIYQITLFDRPDFTRITALLVKHAQQLIRQIDTPFDITLSRREDKWAPITSMRLCIDLLPVAPSD